MSMNIPSIGRIVHYQYEDHERPSEERVAAAVVTAVRGTRVSLKIITDAPGQDLHKVNVRPGSEPGTWSWPPRG